MLAIIIYIFDAFVTICAYLFILFWIGYLVKLIARPVKIIVIAFIGLISSIIGYGIVYAHDRCIYIGKLRPNSDNTLTGTGYIRYNNSSYYYGDYIRSKPHGVGIKVNGNSTKMGQFKNGVLHGSGGSMSDGDSFYGNFVDGMPKSGVATLANGDTYYGEVNDGARSGYGSYVWKDGSKHHGEWLDNNRKGHGIFTAFNGNKLDCEWIDSLPELTNLSCNTIDNNKCANHQMSSDDYVGHVNHICYNCSIILCSHCAALDKSHDEHEKAITWNTMKCCSDKQ